MQKPRLLKLRDAKGEAVVIYREPLTKSKMQFYFIETTNEEVPVIIGGQLIGYLGYFQNNIFGFNRKYFKNSIFVWEAKGEKTLLKVLDTVKTILFLKL